MRKHPVTSKDRISKFDLLIHSECKHRSSKIIPTGPVALLDCNVQARKLEKSDISLWNLVKFIHKAAQNV